MSLASLTFKTINLTLKWHITYFVYVECLGTFYTPNSGRPSQRGSCSVVFAQTTEQKSTYEAHEFKIKGRVWYIKNKVLVWQQKWPYYDDSHTFVCMVYICDATQTKQRRPPVHHLSFPLTRNHVEQGLLQMVPNATVTNHLVSEDDET